MRLEGSCHCGAVTFRLESAHPYPFNLCYCSICRRDSEESFAARRDRRGLAQ
jgi:hypothetical protein